MYSKRGKIHCGVSCPAGTHFFNLRNSVETVYIGRNYVHFDCEATRSTSLNVHNSVFPQPFRIVIILYNAFFSIIEQ